MKDTYLLILIITLLLSLNFSLSAQEESKRLTILHTNDLHSNLTGFSPELEYSPCTTNDDNTIGGFSRIASIFKNELSNNKDNVLILDAGDFLMGTLFHIFEVESGFQLNIMNDMKYDILGLGNHEFDFGSDNFAQIVRSSLKNGAVPKLCLSNIEFPSNFADDDKFEQLYKDSLLCKYYIINRGNMRIGVFSLLGQDAYEVSPRIKNLKITDRIKTSRKIIKQLRDIEKVDLVICLSHSGVIKDKKGNWAGEDVELASKVKGIDIIVSGHTHTEIKEPIYIKNTIIVQTGSQGRYVGKLNIETKDKKIISSNYKLLSVNDEIKGDCEIHQKITNRTKIIDNNLLLPLKFGYYLPIAETNYELTCDEFGVLDSSNLGPLIADAILHYVNNYSTTKADIAMIAAGVIRDKVNVGKNGQQTVSDIFRIVSLGEGEDNIPGYPLAKVNLTAHEIKSVIELLLVASKLKTSYYCFYSGIEVYYDNNKGVLRKIKKIKINGEDIDFSKKNKKLYSITANSYMLEFVGTIRKMSLGLIKVKPKHEDGKKIIDNKKTWIDFDNSQQGIQEGKEWIAMMKYLQSFKDINNNGIPDFPEKYRKPNPRTIKINKTKK